MEKQVLRPKAYVPPEFILLITTLIAVHGKKNVY